MEEKGGYCKIERVLRKRQFKCITADSVYLRKFTNTRMGSRGGQRVQVNSEKFHLAVSAAHEFGYCLQQFPRT